MKQKRTLYFIVTPGAASDIAPSTPNTHAAIENTETQLLGVMNSVL